MSREIRSRRAGPAHDKPLYARILRLRHLSPSGFLCFVFLEGGVALGILLALAELVSWWGVLVLPVTVAVMVKLNDVVAGQLAKGAPAGTPATVIAPRGPLRPAVERPSVHLPTYGVGEDLRRATTVDLRGRIGGGRLSAAALDASALNGPPTSRDWADEFDVREQRARQSAARRYE